MSSAERPYVTRPQLPYQPPNPDAATVYNKTIVDASRKALKRAAAHPQNERLVKDMALLDYMTIAETWRVADEIAIDKHFSASARAEYAQVVTELEPEVYALLFNWLVTCGDQSVPRPYQGSSTLPAFDQRSFPVWCPLEHAPDEYEWLAIFQYIPDLPETTFISWQEELDLFLANIKLGSVGEPHFEGDEADSRTCVLDRFEQESLVETSHDIYALDSN